MFVRSISRILAIATLSLLIQACGETSKSAGAAGAGSTKTSGQNQLLSQSLPFNAEGIQNYIKGLYADVLDRDADQAGLEFWTNAMLNGDTDCMDMTFRFLGSAERREVQAKKETDQEFVTYIYHAIFGRDPDQAGYEFWLAYLQQYTMPQYNAIARGRMIKKFMDNDEFKNRCVNAGLEEKKTPVASNPSNGKKPPEEVKASSPVAAADPALVVNPNRAPASSPNSSPIGGVTPPSTPVQKKLSITSTQPTTRNGKFTVTVAGAAGAKAVRAVLTWQSINGVIFEPSKPTFINMGMTSSTGKLTYTFAIPSSCTQGSECEYKWYIKVDGVQGTTPVVWHIKAN